MFKKLTLIAIGILVLSMPTKMSDASDKPTTERNVINVTLIQPEPTVTLLEVPIVTEPQEPQLISLGEFLVSAYCSCYECCEQYAQNRPLDDNGNEIVYGSISQILTPQYSVAVDPSVIPYGTILYFDGKEHKAQDCGGEIKEKRIDLYFSDHQEAIDWGMQYHEVFILVETEE